MKGVILRLVNKGAIAFAWIAVGFLGTGCDTLPQRSSEVRGRERGQAMFGGSDPVAEQGNAKQNGSKGVVPAGAKAACHDCGPDGTGGGRRGIGDGTLGNPPSLPPAGCSCKGLYDPCAFERYTALAGREVNLAFSPQVMNGHVLDQTIWNHYFECGTDRLTDGGIAHLQYIARRRPAPDTTIYLATALDMPYDANCPERYTGARQELDALRRDAVLKYLTAATCGRPANYQVLLHDPADVSVHSVPIGGAQGAIPQMWARYRGGLTAGGGGGGGGGGGR